MSKLLICYMKIVLTPQKKFKLIYGFLRCWSNPNNVLPAMLTWEGFIYFCRREQDRDIIIAAFHVLKNKRIIL